MAKNENKTKPQPVENFVGRIQPQAPDLERAVLGALMLEKEAFAIVENILSVSDFYVDAHKLIFKSVLNLATDRKPVDILTVVETLRQSGELELVGGTVYIAELTDKVASTAHLEYHARIVKQKAIARKIINATGNVLNMAYDESMDVAEIIEFYEKSLSSLNSQRGAPGSVDMPAALDIFLKHTVELQKAHDTGQITGIPTHLPTLDKALEGGFRPGELVIIGARPSMGKTQHALAAAISAASAGQYCLFVSIEMTLLELISRLILEDESINSRNLNTGQMTPEDWKHVDQRVGELYNKNLFINDHHEIRYLTNIKTEARRLHRQGKLKILIIDYLQKIRVKGTFERRQLEIGYITGELQNLAKELNVPVVLLSQLKRPDKNGMPPEPDLDDLKESGDIEQDANIVLMLHLPIYYEQHLPDKEKDAWRNKGLLIVRKNRRGARNQTIKFGFDKRYKKIYDVNIDGDIPFKL